MSDKVSYNTGNSKLFCRCCILLKKPKGCQDIIMLELNTNILKQAINNAKHMVDHKIMGYTEVPHCKGCVAGQYFWSLQDDDKIRLWDVAKEENVQCACMAVWVMIDKVFKKNIAKINHGQQLLCVFVILYCGFLRCFVVRFCDAQILIWRKCFHFVIWIIA